MSLAQFHNFISQELPDSDISDEVRTLPLANHPQASTLRCTQCLRVLGCSQGQLRPARGQDSLAEYFWRTYETDMGVHPLHIRIKQMPCTLSPIKDPLWASLTLSNTPQPLLYLPKLRSPRIYPPDSRAPGTVLMDCRFRIRFRCAWCRLPPFPASPFSIPLRTCAAPPPSCPL